MPGVSLNGPCGAFESAFLDARAPEHPPGSLQGCLDACKAPHQRLCFPHPPLRFLSLSLHTHAPLAVPALPSRSCASTRPPSVPEALVSTLERLCLAQGAQRATGFALREIGRCGLLRHSQRDWGVTKRQGQRQGHRHRCVCVFVRAKAGRKTEGQGGLLCLL